MLTMQTVNDARNFKQYLTHCLLVLIPAYLLASSVWRLGESPSVLAQYGTLYVSIHAAFMLLALLLSKKPLARWGWWWVILLGANHCCLLPVFFLHLHLAIGCGSFRRSKMAVTVSPDKLHGKRPSYGLAA